jgi:hypothetical protein
MSKAKKPRNKRHKPKPVTYAGGLHLIDDSYRRFITDFPMSEKQHTDVLAHARLALVNLEQGNGSKESWGTLACALNTGLVLCEMGIGADLVDDFVLALDGLFKSEQRAEKFQAHRLDGESMQNVRYALNVHDAQLQVATHDQALQALNTVNQRIVSGNVYSSQETEVA